MKAYFIFRESQQIDGNVLTLISAFAGIESVGHAKDMVGAVEAIQKRHPDAIVAHGGIFELRAELLSGVLSGAGGPLVILPEDYKVKERSVYVEVEFSPENLGNFRWVVWSIQTVIEECNGRTAD